jgi:hypothetical protein
MREFRLLTCCACCLSQYRYIVYIISAVEMIATVVLEGFQEQEHCQPCAGNMLFQLATGTQQCTTWPCTRGAPACMRLSILTRLSHELSVPP